MTLVGRGLEVVISLDEHGVVDEQTQGVWEALETVFKDGVEDFRIEDSLVVFGHGMGLVLLFKPHQTICGRTLNTPVFWGDPMAGISGSSATLHGQKFRPSDGKLHRFYRQNVALPFLPDLSRSEEKVPTKLRNFVSQKMRENEH